MVSRRRGGRGDDGGGHDGYGDAIDNGDGDGNGSLGGDGYGLYFAAHLQLGDGGGGGAPPSAMAMQRYQGFPVRLLPPRPSGLSVVCGRGR
ncbi:unnamed protein product [Urochloa humidicola]